MPRIREFKAPTSVWSAYGHQFMSNGAGADEFGYWLESCLTCGAMFQLQAVRGDWTRGEYTAANGDEPHECSHNTSMAHGYSHERHCEECDANEGCENCRHDCNCVLCSS